MKGFSSRGGPPFLRPGGFPPPDPPELGNTPSGNRGHGASFPTGESPPILGLHRGGNIPKPSSRIVPAQLPGIMGPFRTSTESHWPGTGLFPPPLEETPSLKMDPPGPEPWLEGSFKKSRFLEGGTLAGPPGFPEPWEWKVGTLPNRPTERRKYSCPGNARRKGTRERTMDRGEPLRRGTPNSDNPNDEYTGVPVIGAPKRVPST